MGPAGAHLSTRKLSRVDRTGPGSLEKQIRANDSSKSPTALVSVLVHMSEGRLSGNKQSFGCGGELNGFKYNMSPVTNELFCQYPLPLLKKIFSMYEFFELG